MRKTIICRARRRVCRVSEADLPRPEGICRTLREFAARGSEYVMHGNECVMRGDFYRRAAYSGPKHY